MIGSDGLEDCWFLWSDLQRGVEITAAQHTSGSGEFYVEVAGSPSETDSCPQHLDT